ncbi:MAG: hypothetical protein UIC64_05990 [Agathobacter sp.]|nr:hypothetical protein [Agathobacter sp.]
MKKQFRKKTIILTTIFVFSFSIISFVYPNILQETKIDTFAHFKDDNMN